MNRRDASARQQGRNLSKQEIDRLIQRMIDQVLGLEPEPRREASVGFEPYWISAADLVDRVRPFIVHN